MLSGYKTVNIKNETTNKLFSILLVIIFMISAIQMSIIAVIGDLLSINRKLMEDVQTRIKKLELR